MTRYAIDARTLLHIVDSELHVDPAHQLVGPNFVRSEALQLLLQRVRAAEMTQAQAMELHERLTAVKMRLLGDRVSRRVAWRIAVESDWPTLRDAEYVAIARLQADALVTVDAALAAKAAGTVPTAPVQDLLTAG